MTPDPTVKQSLTVPLEPTEAMLDVAVSFALNVSLSGEYNWSAYMRDVWQRMVKAAPAEPVSREVEIPDIAATFDGMYLVPIANLKRGDHLMTVAQHNRIVAALTPPSPDAELVELLRSKFPRIDPCQPVPLDEKAHCCEYTIYVERERLHRMIDAKLASLEVKL